MCSVCIVGLHVAVNSIKMFCTKILLWRFYVAGNNKMYRDLHARCLMDLFLILFKFEII